MVLIVLFHIYNEHTVSVNTSEILNYYDWIIKFIISGKTPACTHISYPLLPLMFLNPQPTEGKNTFSIFKE